MGAEGLERRLFVGAHHPAVTLDIGGEDHGQFPLHAGWSTMGASLRSNR